MTIKTILLEENANNKLNEILQKKIADPNSVSSTGFIVGMIDTASNSNRDFIIDILETPLNQEESNNKSNDLNFCLNHALQIHDMLIGGVEILGIYCIDFQASLAKQLLTQIFKALNDFDYYKKMNYNKDRLLFTIDTTKKNINMKSLNVADSKSTATSFQQCELKVVNNLLKTNFIRVNSNLMLSSTFKTPNIKSHELLKDDFLNALSVEDMFDDNKFVCLTNDLFLNEDNKTMIDILKLINEMKLPIQTGIQYNNELIELNVKLLENLNHDKSKREDLQSKMTNLDSLYDLNGVCSLIIYISKEASLKSMKKLLTYDLMRSMYARVRLLVEDLDARKEIIGDEQLEDDPSSESSSTEESYQTPNRIHIFLANNIIISDYVFPDETSSDISERVKELFNYDIENENQIVYAEDLPPEIKANGQLGALKKGSSTSSSISSLSSSTKHDNQSKSQAKDSNNSKNQSKTAQEKQKAIYYLSALIIGIFSLVTMYFSFKVASYSTDDND